MRKASESRTTYVTEKDAKFPTSLPELWMLLKWHTVLQERSITTPHSVGTTQILWTPTLQAITLHTQDTIMARGCTAITIKQLQYLLLTAISKGTLIRVPCLSVMRELKLMPSFPVI